MNKNRIFHTGFFLFAAWIIVVLALPAPKAHSAKTQFSLLKIYVTGLKSDEGMVRYALFDSKATYKNLTKAVRTEVAPISKGRSQWIVKGLEYGEYVLVLFHDENDNKKQDKLFGGFPAEPYRYSNNPKVFMNMGKPDYKEVKFAVYRSQQTLNIEGTPSD